MTDDFQLFSDDTDREAAIDADTALITAYLARELSPVQIVAVEARLTTDRDFRRNVQPIIEGWLLPGSFGASAIRGGRRAPTLTRAELDAGWQRVMEDGTSYRVSPAAVPQVSVTPVATEAEARLLGSRYVPPRIGRIAAIVTLIVLPLLAVAQVTRYIIEGSRAAAVARGPGSSGSLTASPLSRTRPGESLSTISGEDLEGRPPATLTRIPVGRGLDTTVRMAGPAPAPRGGSPLPDLTVGGGVTRALRAPITCPSRGDSTRLAFEGIVAIVGTTSITWYDVCAQLRGRFEQQWRVAAPTKDELRVQIDSTIGGLVDQELLLAKASDLGIAVPDSEVIPEGLKRFQDARNRFPTQAQFERELALAGYGTPQEWQRSLNDGVRRVKTFEAIVRKLSEEKLIPPGMGEDAADAMRRYLDQLKKEVFVAVYPDRAYAFAGIK